MNGINLRKLIVHPIKNILFVSFGMEDDELRWVQESSGIQPIEFDEVTPVFAAIAQVKASRGRAKRSIRGGKIARRLGKPLTGSRGRHDDQAGLSAELRRWRAGDNLDATESSLKGAGWRTPCSADR